MRPACRAWRPASAEAARRMRAALVHEVGHLLALDNSDAYSTNVSFTHANDSSPYPPYETSTLDCFNPEWGVVLGTPADAEQSVMRDFLLTNADEPPPRRCLSTDDLAALNYLTAECNYGGRVTDDKDRRTLTTAVANIYCQGILADGFPLTQSGAYSVPVDELGSIEATMDYVRQWPLVPAPEPQREAPSMG